MKYVRCFILVLLLAAVANASMAGLMRGMRHRALLQVDDDVEGPQPKTPRALVASSFKETLDDDDSTNFANDDSDDFSDAAVTITAIIVLVFAGMVLVVVVSFMVAHPDDSIAQVIASPISALPPGRKLNNAAAPRVNWQAFNPHWPTNP